ncbi:hypothetical protein F5B22DRAFT_646037 [Xylaria bambusicola]|uniref:uncharacterized protein n=1 Tax=Xylaria bambusicola TaxID=326684 RepID=UPI002007F9F9|nr:uncharacterized protein F5B22DRAFT_646037 [Xylaria bambusicola]KAI0517399.1 hypothetical protein F5B22DRAFT_646037 [Xylaria bambusicola]
MASRIPDAAEQKQPELLPSEIMLVVIGYIGYNWPDVWGSMRLTSHTWKFEVENFVQSNYLPNMTIWARDKEFKFTHISDQRAVFKLQGHADEQVWAQILESLRHNATDRIIALPDLRTANNAKIIGLQSSYKDKIISIEWLPTISGLFRVESGLRAIVREESEYVFVVAKDI